MELMAGMIVLLQYNPQFGDAFWNSSKYNMVSYLLRIMTSWAIVCDVWYMPPMTREVLLRSCPVFDVLFNQIKARKPFPKALGSSIPPIMLFFSLPSCFSSFLANGMFLSNVFSVIKTDKNDVETFSGV